MDHVAIMSPKWELLEKIISGEKTIESRWYKTRRAPWDKIRKGDIVYFKNSGKPVTLKTKVSKVLQFSELNKKTIAKIYQKYRQKIGIKRSDHKNAVKDKEDKNYCILAFLKNIRKVKPFNIDKTGFGSQAAWLTLEDISKIKLVKNYK